MTLTLSFWYEFVYVTRFHEINSWCKFHEYLMKITCKKPQQQGQSEGRTHWQRVRQIQMTNKQTKQTKAIVKLLANWHAAMVAINYIYKILRIVFIGLLSVMCCPREWSQYVLQVLVYKWQWHKIIHCHKVIMLWLEVDYKYTSIKGDIPVHLPVRYLMITDI